MRIDSLFRFKVITMELHRNQNAIPLYPMANDEKTVSYSVTLPKQVVETINRLKHCGLYGSNRAEITRSLVLDAIKSDQVQTQLAKVRE